MPIASDVRGAVAVVDPFKITLGLGLGDGEPLVLLEGLDVNVLEVLVLVGEGDDVAAVVAGLVDEPGENPGGAGLEKKGASCSSRSLSAMTRRGSPGAEAARCSKFDRLRIAPKAPLPRVMIVLVEMVRGGTQPAVAFCARLVDARCKEAGYRPDHVPWGLRDHLPCPSLLCPLNSSPS